MRMSKTFSYYGNTFLEYEVMKHNEITNEGLVKFN